MTSKKFHSKEYWEIKIQQWLSSGKSAKSWCKENQVIYNTFLGWRNYLKFSGSQKIDNLSEKTSSDPSFSKANFIELKNQPKTCPGISLECEGVLIHLSAEFDAILLKKCLHVLRGSIC